MSWDVSEQRHPAEGFVALFLGRQLSSESGGAICSLPAEEKATR